jgi:protein-tyrosine-phosphatase/DNA-binding transcriptional ArsR family regulator
MKFEGSKELRRRAAKYAALADPARLAIVDTLGRGDASPKELQTTLGMPSNLLAHHLKVLEKQGILIRSGSEGDRRRTYLQLVPSALDGMGNGQVQAVSRVLFVCTANSARSQLAAALWRTVSTVPAASAGTHPAKRIDPGAVAVASRHELPFRVRRPRSVAEVRTEGDFVITVCDEAHEKLGSDGLHWSVADPARTGTDAAFDAAFVELGRRVRQVAKSFVLAGQEGT